MSKNVRPKYLHLIFKFVGTQRIYFVSLNLKAYFYTGVWIGIENVYMKVSITRVVSSRLEAKNLYLQQYQKILLKTSKKTNI